MKIIYDKKDKTKPIGVFISLEDWKLIDPYVDERTELSKIMNELTYKDFFEMTQEEIDLMTTPIIEKENQDALDKGAWISFMDENCTDDTMVMREYKDGRKELVSYNEETGKPTILKTWPPTKNPF